MTRDWFEKEKEVPSIQEGESAKAQARLQEEAMGTRELGRSERVESTTSPSTSMSLETGSTAVAPDAGASGRTAPEVSGTRPGEPNAAVQPDAVTPGKVADTAVVREPGGTAAPRPAEIPPTGDATKVPGSPPPANPPAGDAAAPPKPVHGGAVADVATNLLGTAQHLESAVGRRGEGHNNPRLDGGVNPRVEVSVNPRSETPVSVRLEGQVAVPRMVGEAIDVARGVRPPEDLARDRRMAELTFRSGETLEARVTAGTTLDTLRREVRAIEQRDPGYGTRVQEAYRAMLEGRGGIDAGRPQQPADRPLVPGRPGDSAVVPIREDRMEIRRPNEAVALGHERGALAVDLSRLAGINFGDGRIREAFVDILKRVDAGTFKSEQLDPNGRRVFDAIKGFDPNRLEQIKQFFTTDAQGPGRQRVDDGTIMRRVQEILEGSRDAFAQRRTPDATEGATIPRSATERLLDFMRTNRDVLTQPLDSQASKAALVELGRIVRDMSKELGIDPTRGGIALKDVLARTLEGTGKPGTFEGISKPVEKALLERLPAVREEVLIARLSPAQEAAFRAGLERGGKPEAAAMPTERRPEAARLEAATQVPQRAAQMEGRPGESRPLDARIAAEDAGRPGMRAEQPGIRPELTVKAELAGKPEPGARDLGGKPEAGVQRPVDTTTGITPSRSGDAGGQAAEQVRLAGRTDSTEKPFEDEKKTKKPEESEKDREQEQKAADAALAALMAARKAKEEKERAEKEKEKAQEQDKKEPERRQKYVVKERDTLESIAGKMLRDTRLAPLVLELNKNTIPVRQENGKTVADLRPAMVIWLPTTTDIRDFRGRLMSAPSEPPAPALEDGSVPHAWGKEPTPEEELAARFGGSAEDYGTGTSEKPSETAVAEGGSNSGESVEDMTLGAIAAAKARRANVESMLGPLSTAEGERRSYTVRLGNTLKSVAINHPALQDVRLWKLLAEVNNLSTETDARDVPVVSLKRGSTLEIPSPQEIQEYRGRKGD